eukprot:TRINITY_DN9917_c0_g1_i1.p1 TRINITY_DN9917_c0_g1~~TRINITY_DN9917_c0_g1_i1.p1  ORF type:complete len:252 (-),score=53.35 TRINITY_DN9917_c0_g1_i1:142-897(-)
MGNCCGNSATATEASNRPVQTPAATQVKPTPVAPAPVTQQPAPQLPPQPTIVAPTEPVTQPAPPIVEPRPEIQPIAPVDPADVTIHTLPPRENTIDIPVIVDSPSTEPAPAVVEPKKSDVDPQSDEAVPPPLNAEKLEEFRELERGGVPGVVRELSGLFFKQLDERLPRLQAALTSGDLEDLRFCAHSLKGASGNIGAAHLSGKCLELEKGAKGGVLLACQPLLDALFAEAARVRAALEIEAKIDLSEEAT